MKLEPVIGLEIHVQLKTKSKMFCRCSNAGENAPPNTTICPICLGHPGTLPLANKKAIEWAAKSSLALNCQVDKHSKFDRKHYFYPDLPKGYQISQYDEPIGKKGWLEILVNGEKRKIRIHRLHLEEDAAKLLHGDKGKTFVDFNRGGTPLMEIVTEADIKNAQEAGEFLRELRLIMRYLGVSDADMEKGHLRCDANVSLRPMGDENFYPKTEVKNLNSFKAVEKAIAYEIKRQTKVWQDTGKAPHEQGTRGWDENELKTIEQRTKEDAQDYRYFPEPDIPELEFSDELINKLKAETPELPPNLRERFVNEYGFGATDAKIFSQDLQLAGFCEDVVSELKVWLTSEDPDSTAEEIWQKNKNKLAKLVSSWILTRLLGLLKPSGKSIFDINVTPENMAELITLVYKNKVNATNASLILEEMLKTGGDPSNILEEKDLGQMSDAGALDEIVDKVIAANEKQVQEYRAGKETVIMYFVGQVMKESRGKADAKQAQEILKEKLA